MSVKRIPDPTGIDNDRVCVNLSDADAEAERAAIMEIFGATDVEPRIEQLRSIPALASRVAWLDRRLASAGEDRALHERLRDAEAIAYKIAARPALVRDRKRQAGTSKGGGSRATPAWHKEAIKHARTLLACGTETHELTGKVKNKFGHSDDTVRHVLQDAGLIPKRKTRAK